MQTEHENHTAPTPKKFRIHTHKKGSEVANAHQTYIPKKYFNISLQQTEKKPFQVKKNTQNTLKEKYTPPTHMKSYQRWRSHLNKS